jgi:hypothetical protein
MGGRDDDGRVQQVVGMLRVADLQEGQGEVSPRRRKRATCLMNSTSNWRVLPTPVSGSW